MAKQSILDLLTSSPQQWICSSCRFKDDHVAMLSVVPACPTCGVTLEDTVGIYTAMWMDGLTRRNQFPIGDMMDPINTNYGVLAEHLLNPHLGQANGLLRPDHWAQGEDGTCACPRPPASVKASNVLDKTPLVTRSALIVPLKNIHKCKQMWQRSMTPQLRT